MENENNKYEDKHEQDHALDPYPTQGHPNGINYVPDDSGPIGEFGPPGMASPPVELDANGNIIER